MSEPLIDKLKYTFNTKLVDDRIITQELSFNHKRVMRWAMDTRERGIRQALVALGWTPPDESKVTP